MTVNLPEARYQSAAELRSFHDRMLASLDTLPDVSDAGLINWQPFGTLMIQGDLQLEGVQQLPEDYNVTKASISPGYFRTMGIRLAAWSRLRRPRRCECARRRHRERVRRPCRLAECAGLGKRLSLREAGPVRRRRADGRGDRRRHPPKQLKQQVVPAVYRP